VFDNPGQREHPFRDGCFASIHVRKDSNVPYVLESLDFRLCSILVESVPLYGCRRNRTVEACTTTRLDRVVSWNPEIRLAHATNVGSSDAC
jgi:hypothetical protein